MKEAKEISVNDKEYEQKSENLEIEKIKFKRILFNPKQFEKEISFSKELKKSDLVAGVYEGGFKVWECAIDLIQYLSQNSIDLSGKKVLDLGNLKMTFKFRLWTWITWNICSFKRIKGRFSRLCKFF